MPELPEVETIGRRLKKGTRDHLPVPGQTIQSVKITWDRIIAEPDPHNFKQNLIGKTIIDARRRGKFLHFPLNKGHLIGHLRMSGDMRMEQRVNEAGKPIPHQGYDKVIINFVEPWRMVFSSIRKFGRMWYLQDPQTIFRDLGPEPLNSVLTPCDLYEMLHDHNRQIKPLLLDQNFLAGMGNIYTDEALFRANLHPLRKSESLTEEEATKLYCAIQSTLKEGIRRSGASLDWVYRGGDFQNYFKVYQKDGQPCPNCGTIIEKTHIGQRGTHFCPQCQKYPEEIKTLK